MTTSRANRFLAGMRAAIPVILGFVPAGIAYAIMARQAGFTAAQTCGMSLTVFAGASQMMAAGMYAQGAGIAAIVVATFILNLRHLIMSVCVMDRMRQGKTGPKLLASYGVTDESFAIFTAMDEKDCSVSFFLGLIMVNYISWNIGTLIGAVATDFLPAILTASLAIALYAMFIGLLVPGLTRSWRLAVLVVMTALCNTLLCRFMASSWAMIASTLLCAFAGVFFVDMEDDNEEADI